MDFDTAFMVFLVVAFAVFLAFVVGFLLDCSQCEVICSANNFSNGEVELTRAGRVCACSNIVYIEFEKDYEVE